MAGKTGKRSHCRRFGAFVGGGALVLTALASCSSSTVEPATVYVLSGLQTNANQFADMPCQYADEPMALALGSVQNGVPTATAGVTVTCSVLPNGASFTVSIDVVSGDGSFSVSGTMPSSGTGNDITASLDWGTPGATPNLFSSTGSDCTVALVSTATANGPAIAPGRVWGTVTCPDMTVSGQPGHVCQGSIVFRMENCTGSPTTS